MIAFVYNSLLLPIPEESDAPCFLQDCDQFLSFMSGMFAIPVLYHCGMDNGRLMNLLQLLPLCLKEHVVCVS